MIITLYVLIAILILFLGNISEYNINKLLIIIVAICWPVVIVYIFYKCYINPEKEEE